MLRVAPCVLMEVCFLFEHCLFTVLYEMDDNVGGVDQKL